jgi:gluconokinase
MRYVIGIDIGTGSAKAVAVNDSGHAFYSTQKSYPTLLTSEGFATQDPEAVWRAVITCVSELTHKLNIRPAAISFSCAMHSLLTVNELGAPLTALVIWSDTRSAHIAETLNASSDGEGFYRATGTPIHAMTPLCKIRWLKENLPDVFRQAHKFISIKEFIWWKLFGVYEIDYSIASATGMFALGTPEWYSAALDWAGISPVKLSTPVDTDHLRNGINAGLAQELNIGTDTPFVIGASDGCLANVGSFATAPGCAAITIGSSGAIRIFSKQPVLQFPAMPFCYRLNGEEYICGGPINNGGIVLHWLLQTFMQIDAAGADDYATLFNKIAGITCGADGLLFLPYLTGERAPVWDAKSCGTFFGLARHHTTAHMMRAAVEGVCFAIYEVLEMIEYGAGPIHQLNVSGGFTQSTVWLQMIANVTGKKLSLVQTDDASAVGAGFLALQVLKVDIAVQQSTKIILPQMEEHATYQKYFSVYKTLYPSLKASMHRLYHINH